MTKVVGESETDTSSSGTAASGSLPWEHHCSVSTQDEYGETWEKRETALPVPLQRSHVNRTGLCAVCQSWSEGGLSQDHLNLLAVLGRRQWGYDRVFLMYFHWKIINSCRVHAASRLILQGSNGLQPVFRHSLTTVAAVEIANSES